MAFPTYGVIYVLTAACAVALRLEQTGGEQDARSIPQDAGPEPAWAPAPVAGRA